MARATGFWGTLYGVGVGPGDPELLTLKAKRIIERAPVIAVPVAHKDGSSYAHSIVQEFLRPEQEVLKLWFPMTLDRDKLATCHQNAVDRIVAYLERGQGVAFLTEGDPLIHSSLIHLLRHLPEGTPLEIVPGISSINAAAAVCQLPLALGNQRLTVLPATFETLPELQRLLADFDTVVLLKVSRVLDDLIDLLQANGLIDRAILVEKVSSPVSRVVRDVAALRGQHVHYLSLLIIGAARGVAHVD